MIFILLAIDNSLLSENKILKRKLEEAQNSYGLCSLVIKLRMEGKSQEDVAKILKTTQQQYSKYEIGIRLIPIDKLNILADYYKTSTDYILGRTNIKKPYEK